MKWFRSRVARLSVAAVAVLFFAGCGGTGTVTGKATINGKDMPGGLVTIYDAERSNSGQIQPDGTYTVANVLPGKVTICVMTSNMVGGMSSLHPGEPYGPYVEIPPLYNDPNQSPLKFDVKSGKQEINLELKGEKKE